MWYYLRSKPQLLDCDKYRILTSRDQLPMTSTNCIMTMDHTIPMTNFFHFLLRCLSTAQWATVLLHSTENPSRQLYRYNPPYMRRRRLPSFFLTACARSWKWIKRELNIKDQSAYSSVSLPNEVTVRMKLMIKDSPFGVRVILLAIKRNCIPRFKLIKRVVAT